MDNKFIPDDVGQFIIEKIDSVAELEALLLLHSGPEKSWGVLVLAERLYLGEKEAFELLVGLCTKGLVVHKTSQPPSYQYQPGSVECRQVVDRLAEIYAKHIVPVTNLIHARPKTRVQRFADAFKLRKDD